MILCVLESPITVDGHRIKELQLDFNKIDGNDLLDAERMASEILKERGQVVSYVEALNSTYQACVAAKAANLLPKTIFSLKSRDFSKVCLLALEHLLGKDEPDDADVLHEIAKNVYITNRLKSLLEGYQSLSFDEQAVFDALKQNTTTASKI